MRWISRLLRRRPEPTPTHSETAGHKEAKSALNRAQQARREVEATRQAVSRLAARLAREREMNHFAEMFRHELEGGQR
ncbi:MULTISPECIES: DUF7620 family protein [Streptomyces]|jgi:hypothetical protein